MQRLQGEVTGIFIAPQAGEPTHSVESVMALVGLGLEGDRYRAGVGTFSHKTTKVRQVSMMATEDWETANRMAPEQFTEEETRRNLFVKGLGRITLDRLHGKQIRVGEALLVVTHDCAPCHRPDLLAGKEGFRQAFGGRGGVRLEVAEGGLISIGDPVAVDPDR